jgi:hypothetical protein
MAVAELYVAIGKHADEELRKQPEVREAARRLNVALAQNEAFTRQTRTGLEQAERALRRRTWELNELEDEVDEMRGAPKAIRVHQVDQLADRCRRLLQHWSQT